MSWRDGLLVDLHDKLTPPEFEKLVYVLLDKMGFSDLELFGKSGDGGIDVKATWTQSQVPGLEIDLNFIIQVKRYVPGNTLSPRILRELRGSMQSGEWGLLVTTGRVSSGTREDGLRDPSRIISVIDGSQLVDLCAEYEVGVKREYHFDRSFHEPEQKVEEVPEVSAPPRSRPRDLSQLLTDFVGEQFQRVGNTPIYKSVQKVIIARWSQKYEGQAIDYWYGLKARDLDLMKNYNVTHFAYVTAHNGAVLLPVDLVMKHIASGHMSESSKNGSLIHYHMKFREESGGLIWIIVAAITENVEDYYYRSRKKQ